MTFSSIFKGIEKGLTVASSLVIPVASALYPPAAPFLAKINNLSQTLRASVIAQEANNPKDGQGGLKSAAVQVDLNAYLDTMNAGLAFAGKKIQDDPALRQAAIDTSVAAFNADAKWQASFKTIDLPKA